MFLFSKLDFIFTDGHAIMTYTQFFNKISDLDKLNWEVIKAKYWTDYEDGSRQRQAEFLVHKCFPWEHILCIGVREDAIREKVIGILRRIGKEKPVIVRSDWYF